MIQWYYRQACWWDVSSYKIVNVMQPSELHVRNILYQKLPLPSYITHCNHQQTLDGLEVHPQQTLDGWRFIFQNIIGSQVFRHSNSSIWNCLPYKWLLDCKLLNLDLTHFISSRFSINGVNHDYNAPQIQPLAFSSCGWHVILDALYKFL